MKSLGRTLRELAARRRRLGYRRLGLMLKRQGIKLSPKKLYRLYKEEQLTVRKRGGRKRALGITAPIAIPQDQNLRWSLDFGMDDERSRSRGLSSDCGTRCPAIWPALLLVVVVAGLASGMSPDRGVLFNRSP